MAKYITLDEPVFITKCTERLSQYGGTIYEIHFKSIKSQQDYKTYADPQNANWRIWEHIVKSCEHHGVVLSNIKLKNPDENLVNADSSVKIEMVVLPEILAQELADYWDKLAAVNDSYRKFYK